MAKILPSLCLLVDDIDRIIGFIIQVFEVPHPFVASKPANHCILEISTDNVILIVQKSSINPSHSSYSGSDRTFSKQIFLSVKDPAKIEKLATQAGGQVTESNVDESGRSFIVFEGPENILFHVLSHDRRKDVYSYILNSLANSDQPDDDRDVRSRESPPPRRNTARAIPKNPAPHIPTLDVSILSNLSKNYVPCPPNSRQPIPIETEFFKGIALLVLRTDPLDVHYSSYFGPPKRLVSHSFSKTISTSYIFIF